MHDLKMAIAAARGNIPAEKVIRGARVANVFSFEYEEMDIAIFGNKIVGLGRYDGEEIIEAEGVIIPGLIDGHIHIESSMMTPRAFSDAVLPHGTSCVMADPHEIANVAGIPGVEAMKRASDGLPVDILFGAPSCVPASPFESCREPIGADAILKLFDDGVCQHLGEMMNFPAVIAGEDEVLRKIAAAWKRPLTAHAPLVSGKNLCAYLMPGCDGDHESGSLSEALEKLRRGMWVMMRQGSSARNLEKLLPLLIENPARAARCMVVSDDLTPSTIIEFGHQDGKLRMMIEAGVEPLVALRTITLSPAEYFGLRRIGGIAPGWRADLVLVDSLESCKIKKVWKDGKLEFDNGRLIRSVATESFPSLPSNNLKRLTKDDIHIKASGNIRVIGVEPGSLVSSELCVSPGENGLAKLVVQERHNGSGRIGLGFVSGLGIREGALASSVAHDAHNFIATGADDESIICAMNWLQENGGGVVVSRGQEIVASLKLPIGGLMCELDAATLARELEKVQQAAANLGITGAHPCMALSFLSLSVIPELKLTDRGYIAITKGGVRDLDC